MTISRCICEVVETAPSSGDDTHALGTREKGGMRKRTVKGMIIAGFSVTLWSLASVGGCVAH